MPASRIFRLARTRRWAMVGAGTRKARAISSVVSPPSVRRVRATCASTDSAGWQQVKTSSSRSSGKSVVCSAGSTVTSTSCSASARSLSVPVRSRRMRSTARLRAVVVSQARGWVGTPSRGQRSAAVAKASWAASSASSKLPRRPTRVARTRPHSSRKTASSSAVPRSWDVSPPSTPRPGAPRRHRPAGWPAPGPPPRSPRPGRPPRRRSIRRWPPSSRCTARR